MLPTPSLAAGETATLIVTDRSACDCAEITADAGAQVEESDEQNNVLRDVCLG
jgi:hypothetical protein